MEAPRNQHCNFAFFALPLLAIGNAKEMYRKLDRNNRVTYLKSLWNGLGNKTNEHLSDVGLDCIKYKFRENEILFVIQLPKPFYQPEAFFVGLLFGIETGFLTTNATQARSFTLELSWDVKTNQEVYVVGEMVRGHNFPKFDHKNYGSIIKNDTESFTKALRDVTSGNKSSTFWYYPATNDGPKQIFSGDSVKNTSPDVTEDDLELLWNKWTNYPVDEEAQELCYKAVEPIEKLLLKLGNQCLKTGADSQISAEKIEEWCGEALGNLSRGSFMVGLEYPNFNTYNPGFQQSRPYKLLHIASQQTEKVLTLFLSRLAEKGKISLSEAERIAEEGGKLILKSMAECYLVGVQSSPHN